MKKAFTLAEIMIVLSIVGILTAILLPVAFHSAPDENVMKFKKANNTLGVVIRELVNSDKYYAEGNFRKMPDGTIVNSATYFCETLADVLSTKSVSCSTYDNYALGFICSDWVINDLHSETPQHELDTKCKNAAQHVNAEIITPDGIIYYQASPGTHFGAKIRPTYLSGPEEEQENGLFVDNFDANGFDRVYKVFCIDVDGINTGEAPFGYGIRQDGKILPGARAVEWANKSIQKND